MTSVSEFFHGRSKLLILIVAVVVLCVVGSLYCVSPVGGSRTSTVVVIPKGSTAGQVGEILSQKGLIHSGMAFAIVARLDGSASKIKPGAYKLSNVMSPSQMLDKMVNGDVDAVWVTIPEGFTIEKIAERLAAKKLIDKDEFIALAENGSDSYKNIIDIPAPGLEGYLYPNTYLIPVNAKSGEIIRMMLETFETEVADKADLNSSDQLRNDNNTSRIDALFRIITIASMIEREAKVPNDRPLVSAVIYNRLRLGMRLNIDATVQYALGEHRSRLFYRDLSVDSPYNTYRNNGLPPGPISNPGMDSIKAAIHPAKVDYLYYVAKPDGSHIFTRTLEEHNAAIRRIRGGA